jgi:YD repeat-containing protein
VPLAALLITTHRVLSYTYPSTSLRTGDAVGNHQSLTTQAGVVNYQYDDANRLTSVNGQAYTWDDNGNPSTGSGQACSRTAPTPTPTTTPTGSPRS